MLIALVQPFDPPPGTFLAHIRSFVNADVHLIALCSFAQFKSLGDDLGHVGEKRLGVVQKILQGQHDVFANKSPNLVLSTHLIRLVKLVQLL